MRPACRKMTGMTHLSLPASFAFLLTSALLGSACGEPPFRSVVADGGAGADGGDTRSRPRFEDYIRGDRFAKLVLELDYVAGQEPRSASESKIIETLGGVLAKPGGITFARHAQIASRGADHAWSFSELDALAKETFDVPVDPDTTKMHVLFVDGHSDKDSQGGKVLGLAWAHTHLVIFKKTIEDACRSGLTGALAEKVCEDAEKGVWVHELGHLLGLVDNGLAMATPHSDPNHPAHDRSDACVMFWAYDTGNFLDELRSRVIGGTASPLDFDDACLADLAAVRNR